MDHLEASGRTARRAPAVGRPDPRGRLWLQEPVPPRHRWTHTPLGGMVVAVGAHDGRKALTGVWFEDQRHFPDDAALGEPDDDDPLLGGAVAQLAEWFAGERTAFDLPLALHPQPQPLGPRVWRALLDVPYGATTTYGALARDLGSAGMAQAAGQAVGRNPWSVVVPCHRVLSASGGLTGYAGGLERKEWLLRLEARSREGAGPS